MGRIKPKKLARQTLNSNPLTGMTEVEAQRARFVYELGMVAAQYPDAYWKARSLRDKVMNEMNKCALEARECPRFCVS